MLHFTLDVFDIEPEVEEKIKGLVEKNNKEYKERNHKWNFDAARRKHGGLGLSQEIQVL